MLLLALLLATALTPHAPLPGEHAPAPRRAPTLTPAPMPTFTNPILRGFNPDPSICRVGDDYYLTTSTFGWFPGLPVYHSRDLVHWRLIGHAIHRPGQLDFEGVSLTNDLVYAPTLRHHGGRFYIVSHAVRKGGNFVVWAEDPAGPWSDPVFLPDLPGFDPDLFFDDDGRAWIAVSERAPDADDVSRRSILLCRVDLDTGAVLEGPHELLRGGHAVGAIWLEGPKLYRRDGFYYLLVSEGGTSFDHAVTIHRSKTLTGRYETRPANPILTHRHLGLRYPVQAIGHADLVQTPAGEWWMTVLGTRMYEHPGYPVPLTNTGRETFLVPVEWQDAWPVPAPGVGLVEIEPPRPALDPHPWPERPAQDDFDADALPPDYIMPRAPQEQWWRLDERPGWLVLDLRPDTLTGNGNPSFLGRRIPDNAFCAETLVDVDPRPGEEAGLALVQDERASYRITVAGTPDGRVVRVVKNSRSAEEEIVAEHPAPPGPLRLSIDGGAVAGHRFRFAPPEGDWTFLATGQDAGVLSTHAAGMFTGVVAGLYASSNHAQANYDGSRTRAAFDYFLLLPADAPLSED